MPVVRIGRKILYLMPPAFLQTGICMNKQQPVAGRRFRAGSKLNAAPPFRNRNGCSPDPGNIDSVVRRTAIRDNDIVNAASQCGQRRG